MGSIKQIFTHVKVLFSVLFQQSFGVLFVAVYFYVETYSLLMYLSVDMQIQC